MAACAYAEAGRSKRANRIEAERRANLVIL
jgi:hypothetical protein